MMSEVPTKTYVLYNNESYDLEQISFCRVDLEDWPNFEALATARGWVIAGTVEDGINWRPDAEIHGAAEATALAVLTSTRCDDATVGSVYMPEWLPTKPYEQKDWRGKIERGLQIDNDPPAPDHVPDKTLRVYWNQLRHYAEGQAAVASPSEAMRLHEAWQAVWGGPVKGTWVLIGDAADPLLERATESREGGGV